MRCSSLCLNCFGQYLYPKTWRFRLASSALRSWDSNYRCPKPKERGEKDTKTEGVRHKGGRLCGYPSNPCLVSWSARLYNPVLVMFALAKPQLQDRGLSSIRASRRHCLFDLLANSPLPRPSFPSTLMSVHLTKYLLSWQWITERSKNIRSSQLMIAHHSTTILKTPWSMVQHANMHHYRKGR